MMSFVEVQLMAVLLYWIALGGTGVPNAVAGLQTKVVIMVLRSELRQQCDKILLLPGFK